MAVITAICQQQPNAHNLDFMPSQHRCLRSGLSPSAYLGWSHLEAGRVLAVRLELGVQAASLELLGEALVGRPEEADVWNGEQHHGQAFQAQTKCPCFLPLAAIGLQNLLLHHPTCMHARIRTSLELPHDR